MSTIVNDLISYLQCGEVIAANDAIYIDSADGKIYKFDVNNATETFAGIAKEAGVLDDYIRVVQSGRVKGFAGLTPGVFIYASTTVPGGYQEAEPVASLKVVLGISKSATELIINGGLGIKPGGEGAGGGGLDVYYTEDMEGLADVSGFSTGNNAAFLGAGTLQGTLALETVSPISDTKSLSYTQAAGSLNDWFASELIDVDFKQQNNDSGKTFYFTYDGNDDDGKFVVWDQTNSAEIQNEVALVKTQAGATRYSLSFFVPSTCTQIRWGYQVLVENIGSELVVDEVEISSNPFVFKDILNTSAIFLRDVTGNGIGAEAATAQYGTLVSQSGDGLSLANGNGSVITVNKAGTLYVDVNCITGGTTRLSLNAASPATLADVSESLGLVSPAAGSGSHSVGWNGDVVPGDVIRLSSNVDLTANTANTFSCVLVAETEHVITAAKAGINEFSARITSADVVTSQNTPNDPAIAGVASGATGVYVITYTTDFFSATPSVIASAETDGLYCSITAESASGCTVNIRSDAGVLTDSDFSIAMQRQGSDFKDTALLAAVPVQKTAYIKDVKASTTAGGGFTSGAWQTRDLNTVEGDTGIVSLSANRFTLQSGKYKLIAKAVGNQVNNHQIKLVRDPAGTPSDEVFGSNANASSADLVQNMSEAEITVTLTSPTEFELQHRCETTKTVDGFGEANSFGGPEVYASVTIDKLS